MGDTWIFENEQWRLASESGPSARHGVALGYNRDTRQILLFGGSTVDRQYGAGKGETWIWENENWKQQPTHQMIGLFNAALAYDTDQKAFILFGGWNGQHRMDRTFYFQDNR